MPLCVSGQSRTRGAVAVVGPLAHIDYTFTQSFGISRRSPIEVPWDRY